MLLCSYLIICRPSDYISIDVAINPLCHLSYPILLFHQHSLRPPRPPPERNSLRHPHTLKPLRHLPCPILLFHPVYLLCLSRLLHLPLLLHHTRPKGLQSKSSNLIGMTSMSCLPLLRPCLTRLPNPPRFCHSTTLMRISSTQILQIARSSMLTTTVAPTTFHRLHPHHTALITYQVPPS